MLRVLPFLGLLALTACTWEGRPDGAEAIHSSSDGYYETDAAPQSTPLGGVPTEVEIVEPIDTGASAAPVDLTQPPPTTGTDDTTSEVEEALTPGTER